MRTERALLRTWYGGLLGGLLPILVLGFLYSALADRLAFAGWALAAAAAWVLLLRHGLGAGWETSRLAGAMALLAALGLGAFAWLERRHHEILDLGFRAVLPGIYHPAATRPAMAGVLVAAFAAAGLGALSLRLRRKRS